MSQAVDINRQCQLAIERFQQLFRRQPQFAACAPGRVNLIGEHTDYNAGLVLPMAIERQTIILADRRDDSVICLRSDDLNHEVRFALDQPITPQDPAWSNYARGVVAGCLERGLNPGGFDALIDSTVPTGGGLSSSAALEISLVTLIEAMCDHQLDPIEKAMLAQKAEHDFADMPCGIMDQFVVTLARRDHALLIDCQSHEATNVPIDEASLAFLIINSNVKHKLAGSEYALRRSQCEQAAAVLGVTHLREATLEQLQAAKAKLRTPCYQRARHVITENQRVREAACAMANCNWNRLGQLMLEGHASLRDDFQVSCPELDLLVNLTAALIPSGQMFGSRMTGGGFGGCTISLVQQQAVDSISNQISTQYKAQTGLDADAFATHAAGGACVLNV